MAFFEAFLEHNPKETFVFVGLHNHFKLLELQTICLAVSTLSCNCVGLISTLRSAHKKCLEDLLFNFCLFSDLSLSYLFSTLFNTEG